MALRSQLRRHHGAAILVVTVKYDGRRIVHDLDSFAQFASSTTNDLVAMEEAALAQWYQFSIRYLRRYVLLRR